MSREQIVRDTAYAIWEAEGKPTGRDADHWRQAEAHVAKSGDAGKSKTKVTKIAASAKGKPAAPGKAPAEAKSPEKIAKTIATKTKVIETKATKITPKKAGSKIKG